MFLKREARIQNEHARRAIKSRRAATKANSVAAPRGTGTPVALFLATFSICLWGGGAFVVKEKFDAMRTDLARLSTMAAANTCATENIAAGSNTPSRALAAASPRAEEPFLISQSPLFSMNRLD
jgi:hypothetical protein